MEWFLPEWLVALALTLFVVDIFMATEIMSWCGVFSLSAWLTWRVHANWKWTILLFVGSFVLFAFVYYWGIRVTIGRLVRSWMQKGAPKEITDRIVGAVGVIHQVEGRSFFKWNGEELLPVRDDGLAPSREGEVVVVDRLVDGAVVLRHHGGHE